MAQDTRGTPPVGPSRLRRVSLNPAHWHQARWMLAGEAVLAAAIGGSGVIGVFVLGPRSSPLSLAGVALTPTLSWVLIGIGAAAAVSVSRRRIALWFSAIVSTAALAMVVISAVAAAHHDPGPLGLTAPAIVLWGVLTGYNFALAFWLVPDQIEGPAWVTRRRLRRGNGRDTSSKSQGL